MEITEKIVESNIKALKEAITKAVTVKEVDKDDKKKATFRKVKGHVVCDVYQLHNPKKHGFDTAVIHQENVLVEAAHALAITEQWKHSHKVYIIKEQEKEPAKKEGEVVA